jgi:hypothetical protein
MDRRAHFIRLYHSSGQLSAQDFPLHQDIRCHALKDHCSVIFYNKDTGAVSATLPSLQDLAQQPSVIAWVFRPSQNS